MRTHSIAITGFVLLFVASSSEGHQCPGDTSPNKNARIDKRSETSLTVTAQTWLLHFQDHPSCHANGGSLSALAQLFNTFGFTGCESGEVGTHTNALADTDCNDLAQETYHTKGTFKFADSDTGSAESSTVTLAGPPPPPPPPENEGECSCADCVCSPLVVDLGSNGFQFSGSDEGALFGLSGPLHMYWVAWPQNADDRWLAKDRNANGLIDDGSELFGTATRLANGHFAQHGYQALAELDANGDGEIDVQDPGYGSLLLWGDVNRNGLSEPSELTTLASAGVASISLDFRNSSQTDEWGNRFALRSHARAVSPPRTLKVSDVFPVWRSAP